MSEENKERKGCSGCALMIIGGFLTLVLTGVFLVAGGCLMLISLEPSGKPSPYDPASLEEEYAGGVSEESNLPKIAVIDVEGIIISKSDDSFSKNAVTPAICLRIRRAAEDKDVKAVIINLNTPGGEVTAADEIYEELCNLRKIKPVIAMMNTMAASGGYYIAAACKPIIANKNVLTGSIGVIISTYNYAGLFQKIGLQSEIYASGKMKDMLNGARVRTPAEIAVVHELVNNSYSDFVRIVSRSRNIPEYRIRTTEIGDGRILDGRQALKLGLVDKLGYFKDAVEAAAHAAKLGKKSYTLIRYKDSFSFSKIFSLLGAKSQPVKISLQGQNEFIPKPGVLYFLPAGF